MDDDTREHYRRVVENAPVCDVCGLPILDESVVDAVANHLGIDQAAVATHDGEVERVSHTPGEEPLTVCQECEVEVPGNGPEPVLRFGEEAEGFDAATADVDPDMVSLAALAVNPDATTSDIAKDVFDPADDAEMRNADRKVRYYFEEKLSHLIECDDTGDAKRYRVDDSRVWLGTARVELHSVTGDAVSMGLGVTVMYIDGDGRPVTAVLGGVGEPAEPEAAPEL